MWKKDQDNEIKQALLDALQKLPENIAEAIARQPNGPTGERTGAGRPGTKKTTADLADFGKSFEQVLGHLGRLSPLFTTLHVTLRNVRTSLEAIAKLRNWWGARAEAPAAPTARPANQRTEAAEAPSVVHRTRQTYDANRARWARTVASARERGPDYGARSRAEWVKTVAAANAAQTRRPSAAAAGAADVGARSRAEWLNTVLAAGTVATWRTRRRPPVEEPRPAEQQTRPAPEKPRPAGAKATEPPSWKDLGNQFLRSMWSGKPLPQGYAEALGARVRRDRPLWDAQDFVRRVSPAALRRYAQYGSLGEGDELGQALDRNPALADFLKFAHGAGGEAGIRRLVRRPGLPVPLRGQARLPVPPRVRVIDVKPAGVGLPVPAVGGGSGVVPPGRSGPPGAPSGPGLPVPVPRGRTGLPVPPWLRVVGATANPFPGAPGPGWGSRLAGLAGGLARGGAAALPAAGIAAAGLVAFGAALAVATKKLHDFSVRTVESYRPLSQYSTQVANTFANLDLARFQRGRTVAEALAPDISRLAGAVNQMEQSVLPQRVFWGKVKAGLGTGAATFVRQIAEDTGPAFEWLNQQMGKDNRWQRAQHAAWTGWGVFFRNIFNPTLNPLPRFKEIWDAWKNGPPQMQQSSPWVDWLQSVNKGPLRPPRNI